MTALMGAVVANLVVIAHIFTVSAIFGAAAMTFDGARGRGDTQYGLAGGGAGIRNFLLLSLLSVGILPLLISVVGAGIALVRRRWSAR